MIHPITRAAVPCCSFGLQGLVPPPDLTAFDERSYLTLDATDIRNGKLSESYEPGQEPVALWGGPDNDFLVRQDPNDPPMSDCRLAHERVPGRVTANIVFEAPYTITWHETPVNDRVQFSNAGYFYTNLINLLPTGPLYSEMSEVVSSGPSDREVTGMVDPSWHFERDAETPFYVGDHGSMEFHLYPRIEARQTDIVADMEIHAVLGRSTVTLEAKDPFSPR